MRIKFIQVQSRFLGSNHDIINNFSVSTKYREMDPFSPVFIGQCVIVFLIVINQLRKKFEVSFYINIKGPVAE